VTFEVRPRKESRSALIFRGLVTVWRSRIAWAIVASGVSVAILLALAATWAAHQLRSPECSTWEVPELGFDAIVALKRQADRLQQQPSPDLVLTLSEAEANFVLRELLGLESRVTLRGSVIVLDLSVPRDHDCYNIAFSGNAKVRQGMLIVEPVVLRIGDMDVARFLPRRFGLTPRELRGLLDEQWLGYLDGTERLDVRDGRVQVRLRDYDAFW
jgi:hypothetical protein